MTEAKHPTLRQRLQQLPPFLVFNLARVPNPPMTPEELRRRLWNRAARRERWLKKMEGNPEPRRPRYLAMTTERLSKRTGIKERRIRDLRNRLDWDDVPVELMLKFLEGCEVELCARGDTKRNCSMRYRAQHKKLFSHLDKNQMRRLLLLLEAWQARMKREVP